MNQYSEIFNEMLDVMDFDIEEKQGGYALFDRQREVYIRDYGSSDSGDLYKDAEAVAERLDTYINDYYIEDLEREADEYGVFFEEYPTTLEEWAEYGDDHKDSKFVEDHEHGFAVADMLSRHIEDVDLSEIAVNKDLSKKEKNILEKD